MAQKKPEQYYHIGVMGREIHDYWKAWKPELYRELQQKGTLWTILESEGMRLDDMIIDLMQNGMSEDMAKEVARAEIYGNLTE